MKSKPLLITGIAVAGGGALYSVTQAWVLLSLSPGAAAFSHLEVTGQQANQSLSPVAIAALAAALALTIAGGVLRRVLGVLVLLLGAAVGLIAVAVLNDPAAAASGRLTEATGLAGAAQAGLVASVGLSPMVGVALVAGLLLVLLGGLVLVYGRRWGSAGRRYEADAGVRADADEPDRIADWEALGQGADPSVR